MYKLILAARYLIKRRITYLAVIAVAVCVFMVIVVLTVMNGLLADFEQKNHRWFGDCIVGTDSLVGFPYYEDFLEKLDRADFIQAASPMIKSYALWTVGQTNNRSVELRGIIPQRYCKVSAFDQALYYNKNDCNSIFEPNYAPELPGAVVGIEMFSSSDETGEYHHPDIPPAYTFNITCFPLTPKGALAKAGLELVNSKKFYYSDDVHSGLAQVDGNFVYIPFETAQQLAGMTSGVARASAIYIKFTDNTPIAAGLEKVNSIWADFKTAHADSQSAELLENVDIQSWRTYRREVIAPIEHEKMLMIAVFAMIAVITVFIVLVVFYMIVAHKIKDIGILKSLGAVGSGIMQLYLIFAAMVGLSGSAVGATLAVLFLNYINPIEQWLYENFEFQLWNRQVYAIGDIPNKIETSTVAVIIVSAIIVCLVGALIPCIKAARQQPVNTLQVTQI